MKALTGLQAKQIFKKKVKGQNPLTPEVLEFGGYKLDTRNYMVYELSQSYDETVFGVTVVKDGEPDRDLSKAFEDKGLARQHINKLMGVKNGE